VLAGHGQAQRSPAQVVGDVDVEVPDAGQDRVHCLVVAGGARLHEHVVDVQLAREKGLSLGGGGGVDRPLTCGMFRVGSPRRADFFREFMASGEFCLAWFLALKRDERNEI